MKKIWIMLLGAGLVTFGACTTNQTTEHEIETVETDRVETTDMDGTAGTMDNDAMYRERADRYATQMNTDLNLDTMQQRRVQTTYYNRSRRYGDLQSRYNTDTTGMYNERVTIDRETDAEFKSYLRPDQWTIYERNRSNYTDSDFMNSSAYRTDGAEVKIKSGDTKMKMDGDETKYKSGDTKMKTDGDETKYKSGDTKIKTDGDESKYKSGDTKIKTDGDDYKYKSGDTKIKVDR